MHIHMRCKQTRLVRALALAWMPAADDQGLNIYYRRDEGGTNRITLALLTCRNLSGAAVSGVIRGIWLAPCNIDRPGLVRIVAHLVLTNAQRVYK